MSKSSLKPFLALAACALAFLALPSQASAGITRSLEAQIYKACHAKAAKNGLRDPKLTCQCVAQAHVREAMENPANGAKSLEWVIAYYRETDERKIAALIKRNPALAEFDMEVATSCFEKYDGR